MRCGCLVCIYNAFHYAFFYSNLKKKIVGGHSHFPLVPLLWTLVKYLLGFKAVVGSALFIYAGANVMCIP